MSRTFSGSNRVVVAVSALIRGLTVIDGLQCGAPDIGGMTTIAEITGQWMGDGFKGTSADTIVATALGAGLPRH